MFVLSTSSLKWKIHHKIFFGKITPNWIHHPFLISYLFWALDHYSLVLLSIWWNKLIFIFFKSSRWDKSQSNLFYHDITVFWVLFKQIHLKFFILELIIFRQETSCKYNTFYRRKNCSLMSISYPRAHIRFLELKLSPQPASLQETILTGMYQFGQTSWVTWKALPFGSLQQLF